MYEIWITTITIILMIAILIILDQVMFMRWEKKNQTEREKVLRDLWQAEKIKSKEIES